MAMEFFRKQKKIGMSEFIRSYALSSKRSRGYRRRYINLATILEEFEAISKIKLYTDSLTYQVSEDFVYFLKNRKPYRSSTIKSFISSIVATLNRVAKEGYRVDYSIVGIKTDRDDACAVALSAAEIESIYSLKLRNKSIENIRDMFVIGCCTGLRFSDYSRLTIDDIRDECIHSRNKKTGITVVVPQHSIVREIVKKRGSFPVLESSRQNFNKVVKNLCKKSGISQQFLIERMEGSKIVKRKYKKYELVSSHTARRSFATNAYSADIPTAKIMLITGHVTEESFFKYIRIDKKENAKDLATHAFFAIKLKETTD